MPACVILCLRYTHPHLTPIKKEILAGSIQIEFFEVTPTSSPPR